MSESHDFMDTTYKSSTKHVIIFDGITRIPSDAFYGWPSLISVIINDLVTLIGTSAFSSCTGLIIVILEENLETIGDFAF